MKSNEEVSDSIRPLLKLCREQIDRSILLDRTLLKTLERDPLLSGRLERLRTIPGVGPLTALTWVLEIGDVSRFRSIKQAISYCGLCGEEVRSADKVMRTPISKQRNKHIQSMLVEAARLAPALQPRAGSAIRPRTAERRRQPSHVGRSSETGRTHGGRRKTTEQLPAGGRVQADRGSLKNPS